MCLSQASYSNTHQEECSYTLHLSLCIRTCMNSRKRRSLLSSSCVGISLFTTWNTSIRELNCVWTYPRFPCSPRRFSQCKAGFSTPLTCVVLQEDAVSPREKQTWEKNKKTVPLSNTVFNSNVGPVGVPRLLRAPTQYLRRPAAPDSLNRQKNRGPKSLFTPVNPKR